MNQLGIEHDPSKFISKQTAKEVISAHLDKDSKNGYGAPVEKIQTTSGTMTIGKPMKEYHLSPEAVRVGALDAAIKVTKKLGTEDYTHDLMAQAEEFEEWINGIG